MYNDSHSCGQHIKPKRPFLAKPMTNKNQAIFSATSAQHPLEELPNCDSHLVHLEQVRQAQSEILPMEKAQHLAELFNTLADPNRLRLLFALDHQELCVCDLAAILKMSESAVSHQLRVLRSLQMVTYRKEGRNVYYSLAAGEAIELYHSVTQQMP
jgi:DNA-binding transcriptional ArsR family regulator